MTSTTSALDERVLRIVSELTAVPLAEIRPEHELRADLGMDSVSSMELLSMFAEELDVDVELEEAIQVRTVAALLEMARQKAKNVH
ncbi:MAG: hypothetical protein AMXMBFR64_38540 [Myxococcales bacterium]